MIEIYNDEYSFSFEPENRDYFAGLLVFFSLVDQSYHCNFDIIPLVEPYFLEENWFSKNQDIPNVFTWEFLFRGKYQTWIFSDTEFIRGIITASDSLNIDFRDYMTGLPRKNGEEYAIEGYE